MDTPPGDDELTVKGEFTRTLPLDPLASGVRLLVDDAQDKILDLTIPGGAFDRATGVGWKVNKAVPPTKWTYVDETASPPAGTKRVVVRDRSVKAAGLTKFAVKGEASDYTALVGNPPLNAALVLLSSTECGELRFPGEPGPSCALSKLGRAFKCN